MIKETSFDHGDLRFHCLTAGDPAAPLLLFLHGFPEYSGAWTEMLARLSDQFFCVAPDQRGYGRSSKPAKVSDYAAGKLAADAAAALEHFAPAGAARAVIGHDWGASVAYALAFSRPRLMERLIILNGAHPIPFQRALAAGGAQSAASQYFHYLRDERAEARLSADGYARLEQLFADGMDLAWLSGARRAAYMEAWSRPGALNGMLNWYRATPLQVADPGAPLAPERLIPFNPARLRVKMPHLLVWGAGDTALLPEASAGLEVLCDRLTRVSIEDADHWLHHQKPDEVAALIAGFCLTD
ncbi:MAG: alpha/beta hydrolase [Paracoccaceae bacterium]